MFGTSRNNAPPPPPKAAPYAPPQAARVRPARTNGRERWDGIAGRVQQRLLSELSPTVNANNVDEVRRALERIYSETLVEQEVPLSRAERGELFDQIIADILGFGPIEPLLQDESVTEILVNGPHQVYVERHGKLEETDIRFRDNEDVMRIIERIVAPLGRRVDESSPMVDARLPDGSRVNVIIPPLSLDGPVHQHPQVRQARWRSDDLIRMGTLTQEMVDFLRACVLARLNIVVSGGTGTGKTTLLNMLSTFIPGDERIVTIEDAAELQLQQQHVVRLEARAAQRRGQGAGQHPPAGDQRPAYAPRPHRRRRGARRRGAGHAPGHEHRP